MFVDPEWRHLIETPHLQLDIPSSLTLNVVQLWLSIFVSTYWRKSFSGKWLRKTLINEYRIISLGVIVLLYSFSRTAICRFPLGPCPVLYKVLGLLSCDKHWFHLKQWALILIRQWLDTLTLFVLLLQVYLAGRWPLSITELLLDWYFSFSFGSVQSIFSTSEYRWSL